MFVPPEMVKAAGEVSLQRKIQSFSVGRAGFEVAVRFPSDVSSKQ